MLKFCSIMKHKYVCFLHITANFKIISLPVLSYFQPSLSFPNSRIFSPTTLCNLFHLLVAAHFEWVFSIFPILLTNVVRIEILRRIGRPVKESKHKARNTVCKQDRQVVDRVERNRQRKQRKNRGTKHKNRDNRGKTEEPSNKIEKNRGKTAKNRGNRGKWQKNRGNIAKTNRSKVEGWSRFCGTQNRTLLRASTRS